jgi:hypothetical protein
VAYDDGLVTGGRFGDEQRGGEGGRRAHRVGGHAARIGGRAWPNLSATNEEQSIIGNSASSNLIVEVSKQRRPIDRVREDQEEEDEPELVEAEQQLLGLRVGSGPGREEGLPLQQGRRVGLRCRDHRGWAGAADERRRERYRRRDGGEDLLHRPSWRRGRCRWLR